MIVSTLLASQLALAAPSPEAAAATALDDLSVKQTLTLDKAGSAPRRVIGFAPVPGRTATYELVTKQALDMAIVGPDGNAMPMPGMGNLMPTMVMKMSSTVGDPVADGIVPVVVRYESASVEGGPPEVQQRMKPMLGTGFRLLVDPAKGRVVQVDVSTEDPVIEQAMQGMADQFVSQLPAFPEEPVGIGAEWTIAGDMSVAGLSMESSQTVTLVEMTDTHVTTDVVFALRRGDGPVGFPGLPPGADVDFTRFEGKGKGRYIIDLGTLSSLGSMTMDVNLGMKMSSEGQDMGMTMDMTQEMTLREAQ